MNFTANPQIARAIVDSGQECVLLDTSPTPSRETAEIAGRISVDADALHQVLQALVGPEHHIRELQFTRSLHKLGHPNPIDTLIENYEVARATGEQQS